MTLVILHRHKAQYNNAQNALARAVRRDGIPNDGEYQRMRLNILALERTYLEAMKAYQAQHSTIFRSPNAP